jgi:hypothetical protein
MPMQIYQSTLNYKADTQKNSLWQTLIPFNDISGIKIMQHKYDELIIKF